MAKVGIAELASGHKVYKSGGCLGERGRIPRYACGMSPGTSVPHALPDTKYIKAEVVWAAVPQTGWNQGCGFAQPPLHRRVFGESMNDEV
jgi:hypothetical protein